MASNTQDNKFRTFISRLVQAAKLDISLYEYVKTNAITNWQAYLTAILASLATSVGIGLAGMFRWAGLWSIWGLLIILISLLTVWLVWSFLVYLIGTRIFKSPQKSLRFGGLVRSTGFATSPVLLGIFLFIPVVGWIILIGAFIWVLITGVIAVRQALSSSTARAIVTCLLSSVICMIIIVLTAGTSLKFLIDGSCTVGSRFDSQINSIVKSNRFSIITWTAGAIPHEISQWVSSINKNTDNEIALVTEYFSANAEGKRELENAVELILENQVEEILIEKGIFGFPPVNLKLDTMPHLLVISPRGKIESMREIMLDQNLSYQEMGDIENKVDELNVSSLVVQLGGFGGTYPSFVDNNAGLRFTVKATVEEWVHQYLASKPLGFRYLLDLLGISRNYEIATMNETAAGIISDEICTIICDRYYPEQEEPVQDLSDFYSEMRTIRLAVDDFLAKGEIDQAEEYMEQKRQYLSSKGYHIRKLNQAYFAWHGTYADKPDSVSPIGAELRLLRGQCDSLKEFLDTVAMMTSRENLQDKVGLPE